MNSIRHFDRTPWKGDRRIARPLPTQNSTIQKSEHIIDKGFELTIPVFELFKNVPFWLAIYCRYE